MSPSSSAPFTSAFKALYDGIVETHPTPAGAVAMAIAYEEEHQLTTPSVYASTAITSAGFARDGTLTPFDAIVKNNHAAADLAGVLADQQAPYVTPDAVMMPTELGAVASWTDSGYLAFYFCWLAGLSAAGAEWVTAQLADPVYAGILEIADCRKIKDNEQRWPHYRAITEVLLANIALAEARPDGKRSYGAGVLLQLIDVNRSLGCRAEALYAQARGLDRFTPTLATELPSPLAQDVAALTALGAEIGTPRKSVELVPVLDIV